MRLIDADALIARLEKDAEQMEDPIAIMFTHGAINDIKHEPTITVPQWIPLGAPMNSGQHYIVTLRQKFEGEETYRVRIMRLNEGHWVYPRHFPEWINDEMEQEVVAWMPLPEPYDGGEQDG